MPDSTPPESRAAVERTPDDRLDSWKEIAGYMRRDVTTVQRWEKREDMPVHRHLHDKAGSVYAFRSDLDAWARTRSLSVEAAEKAQEDPRSAPLPGPSPSPAVPERDERNDVLARPPDERTPPRRRARAPLLIAVAAVVLIAALAVWQLRREPRWENPLADARFQPLTDFDGIEQAAAVSRDGRFVAFVSDRDGKMDVWVTQLGTGQFVNLTHGTAPELVNPSVRTLGFTPDASLVTFWVRRPGPGKEPDIGVWSAPLLGGSPRPYLEGAAELDWSRDGSRLVYHTPGPGDPMYVREPGQRSETRNIFVAPAGLHSHFLLWAPDDRFIYFVQGSLPDHLDLWRIRPTGGAPERITHHDSQVSHPVFLDARTLLYLVTDADGFGPCIYSVDVEQRVPRRVSFGVDSYTSLAASADATRLVATRATPKRTLWRVAVAGGRADMSTAERIPLTTGNGSSPRLGPGYLLYVSSKGASDTLWKLQDGAAMELWSAPDARVIGAPAIRQDGRIVFSVRQGGGAMLVLVNADGTDARVVTDALALQGAPAWAPDGRSITVAGVVDGAPRLFNVPVDGGAPVPFLGEHSVDPVWSPRGDFVAFSGADVGTTFPVKAVNMDASAHRIPALTLTRGARHLAFADGGRSLVVLRGEIRHKNLSLFDLETGAERPLTDLPKDFDVRDFGLSPDGRELVLEQVQEHSDVVLIEPPRR